MANQPITRLPVATSLNGNEVTVVVQNGVTKQVNVELLASTVAPGKLIDTVYFDSNSDLVFVYTDGTQQSVGPIPGYVAAEIAPNGHLILTNSDGGTTDAGSVFASLSQSFLTVNNEPDLPNSQRLAAGTGIALASTGPQGTLTISATGAGSSLIGASNGLIAKTSSTTVAGRTLTSGSTGISISNGDGVSGNPTVGLSGKLADLEALNTNGILVVNGPDVLARNLLGTPSQIDVSFGDGTGNPVISLNDNPVLPGTGSVTVPTGTTAQRPGSLPGQIRFNTEIDAFEGQNSTGTWLPIALGSGVTSITAGTGLTGGVITTVGTIAVDTSYTATVATEQTLTNKTISGLNNTLSNIGNSSLTNSSVTYNGVTVALGSSGTITAVNPSALTIGTGLLGTSYNGSTPVTIEIDSTVATLTGTQTLTNKTISGANNTLTNIGNSSLVNSSVTVNGNTVALGGSTTVTANTTNALTIGTGLSGTSFNGGTPVTIAISNTGVTAATYGAADTVPVIAVNAQGQATSVVNTPIAISHTAVSGLGSAALLNAGVANGVATLDAGGTVPLSQIPASIQGGLIYQGTWNAATNTPTLTSSVGTKGHYYVVSVAGTTNLNGITDWNVGDIAVFNGSVWEQIDNTDAVTSVNGYTGAVVLTQPDIVGTAASGANSDITSMSGITGAISTVDYVGFDTTYATTLTAGQLGWNGNNNLGLGMFGGNVIQHIGEDQYFYIKATGTISKGQVVMFTGAVGSSGVPTGAPATGVTDGSYIMGIAAENIANNGFGLIQTFGTLRNVNTSGFSDGDILWYDPSVAGGYTNVKPSAPNVKVQVAAVTRVGTSNGSLVIRINAGSTLGGTDSNAQFNTPTNGNIITYDGLDGYWKNTDLTAGTAISVTKSSTGVLTVTNTAPDQTVSIGAGTGISVSGTYPNFTIGNTGVTAVSGTTNEIEVSAGTGSVTIGLPNDVTVAGTMTATNYVGISGGTF